MRPLIVASPPLMFLCAASPQTGFLEAPPSVQTRRIPSNQTLSTCPGLSSRPSASAEAERRRPSVREETPRRPLLYPGSPSVFDAVLPVSGERAVTEPSEDVSRSKTKDLYYKPAFQKSKHAAVIWALPLTAGFGLKHTLPCTSASRVAQCKPTY